MNHIDENIERSHKKRKQLTDFYVSSSEPSSKPSLISAIPAGAFGDRVLNSSDSSVREQNSSDSADFEDFVKKFTTESSKTSSALNVCDPARSTIKNKVNKTPDLLDIKFSGLNKDIPGNEMTIKVPSLINEISPLLKAIKNGKYCDKEIEIDFPIGKWKKEQFTHLFNSFLLEDINGDNAFDILELSRRLLCEDTVQKCAQFIAKQLEESLEKNEITLEDITKLITEFEIGLVIEPALSEALSRKISNRVYESFCSNEKLKSKEVEFWQSQAKNLKRFYAYENINEDNIKLCLKALSPENICMIDISCSRKITSLDSETFSKLTALQHLKIGFCTNLQNLDKAVFSNLTALQTLDMHDCYRLTTLDKDLFSNLTALQTLDINDCISITTLDKELLSNLSALQTLNIGGCHGLTMLDKELFSNLTALQWLRINGCFGLTKLDKELFSNLTALQTLEMCNISGLTDLDKELFSNLTALKTLNISMCPGLTTLDKELFSNLTALQTLNISMCPGLRMLDKELFSNLTNLKTLNISGCTQLTDLDKDYFSLNSKVDFIKFRQ